MKRLGLVKADESRQREFWRCPVWPWLKGEGDARSWLGGMSRMKWWPAQHVSPDPGYQGENNRESSAGFRPTVCGQKPREA